MLRAVVTRPVFSYRALLVRLSSSSIPPPSYSQLADPAAAPAASDVLPQAPNRAAPWSASQRSRPRPNSNPRFEQTVMDLQPAPLSAMELIDDEPIRLVEGRRAVCDGGGGPLGHPKIFINLDKPGPRPCGYWSVILSSPHQHHSSIHDIDSGIRFEQKYHH